MSRSGQRHEHRREYPEEATVTALTVITVTSVVSLERTATGSASTKLKPALA